MACINMVNSEHQGLRGVPAAPPPIGPRISFSSDFVVEPPAARNPGPPPDPNFEFAVGGDSMIDADKLFFKGRLLPLKESHQCGPQRITTTLKEELRATDEWERPLRGSIKWKELLGLKKSHCSSAAKKNDKPAQEDV